jgi:hypothetical protein
LGAEGNRQGLARDKGNHVGGGDEAVRQDYCGDWVLRKFQMAKYFSESIVVGKCFLRDN